MSWLVEYTESTWRNLNMDALQVDQAYIHFTSNLNKKIWIYYLSADCVKCPYTRRETIIGSDDFKIDSSRPFSLKLFDKNQGEYLLNNQTSICTISENIGEFGVYNLTLNEDNSCDFIVDKEPVNIYTSFAFVLALLVLFWSAWQGIRYGIRKYQVNQDEVEIVSDENVAVENIAPKKRLKSLDLFRGMAIILMIFVNSGGGKYWWIEHAPWNGLHLADIVFPSFLWIMGVCIPISISGQVRRGTATQQIVKSIFLRFVKLFAIGICLNSMSGPLLSELRIMGVLQRFAVCYLVCALFFLFSNIISQENILHRRFGDIILMRRQIVLEICLLATYLAVIFGARKPNCPVGYFGPGGKHEYLSHQNCTGGVIGYIDEKILGSKHIYQHSTAKNLYDAQNFDPEGIFGCIMSILQVFLGIQCGVIITLYSDWKSKSIRLLTFGLSLCLIGGALCGFSIENGFIPINKNLWSLSYVYLTSGMSFLILLILYAIVDEYNLWNGYPFVQSGMNAIIMYVGHSIMHKILPWHWRIGLMNTHFILLLESCWNTTVWIFISIYLYNKKIFYNL